MAGVCTFLIADDDAALRTMLELMLGIEPGWSVIGQATNGTEAVELVASGCRPDVILLDLNMPHMDGYDVIRELKHVCPPLEIVVYSGEDERVARARVQSLAPFEYIVKGDPTALLKRLHTVCQRRHPELATAAEPDSASRSASS